MEGLIVGERLPVVEEEAQRLPLNVAVAQPVEEKDIEADTQRDSLLHVDMLAVEHGDALPARLCVSETVGEKVLEALTLRD